MNLALTGYQGQKTNEPEVDKTICYHCDQKVPGIAYCERWTIWACASCITKNHRSYHPSCEQPAVKASEETLMKVSKYFTLSLTRFDGSNAVMFCKLGDKINMEDHWLGTYVFSAAGMMLVRDKRAKINEMILQGLASAK